MNDKSIFEENIFRIATTIFITIIIKVLYAHNDSLHIQTLDIVMAMGTTWCIVAPIALALSDLEYLFFG